MVSISMAVVLAAVSAVAVATTVAAVRFRRRWAARRRLRRARAAELAAPGLLRAAGLEVIGEQVSGSYEIEIDGEPRRLGVRADYLARCGGRVYVVEVKSGAARDPLRPATRRQLLEYQHAFSPDGVLLADVEGDRLLEIGFPTPSVGSSGFLTGALVGALVCAVAAAAALWLAVG